MDPTLQTQTLLPATLPGPALAVGTLLLAVLWVWSHRLSRPLPPHGKIPAFAGRCLLGTATLVAAASTAARFVTYATPWPLWAILGGGAVLVETLVALYHLERQTLARPAAIALSLLRVTLLLGLIAMLCQPVLVIETARHVQRQVAIVLDDTASMHVVDTGMSPSEKLRLAEALGVPAARRTCRFETTAVRLRSLQDQLQARADLLASLVDVDPAARAAQSRHRAATIRGALVTAQQAAAAESNAFFDAAATAVLHGDLGLRTSIDELAVRLATEVTTPLQAAIGIAASQAKGETKAAEPADALLTAVRRAGNLLGEIAQKIDPLADKLDEAVYRSLQAVDRAAVDRAVAVPRSVLARTLLTRHPTASGASPVKPSLMERLDAAYGVRLYRLGAAPVETRVADFLENPVRTNAPAQPDEPAARTDLAGALDKVMADLPPEQTAGVLLLSDGRHNAPSPIEPVARALGLERIPVFPVVFGGARVPPADAAIAAANAPEAVSTNDRVVIDIDLKLDGLAGTNVEVELLDGDRLVASNVVLAVGDAFRRHIQLSDTPRTNGLHQYRVFIPALPSEVLTNNNEVTLPVSVGADPMRVLLIEGRPRWEFRYFKNLFAGRDSSVRLQYVLFHPDRIADMPAPPARTASVTNGEDEADATALPATQAEWMKFDVIVLGDVAPEELGLPAMRMLRTFVTERGGTLVVIAGSLHMPHAYMGTPLADVLPVQCLPSDRPVLVAPEEEFRIAPTAEGRNHILLRLVDDDKLNAAAWDGIPPLRWRHSLRDTKEGATVLAYALPADPPEFLRLGRAEAVPDEETMTRRREFERGNALVVVQHVALGNVLFLATDNMWRLRYRRGDQFHHRFWGQVLRWATADRMAAGTLFARLGTDRPRYALDMPVNVRARLMSADFAPIRQAPVAVTVWAGDRKILRRNLPYQADSAGVYAASLGSFPEGRYRIELDTHEAPGLPEADVPRVTEFAVTPEIAAERVELSADRGLLTRVAGLTGGRLVEPAELEHAATLLGPAVVTLRERRQIELWDSWVFFLLLVTVVTTEWILRKKERLP